MYPGKIPLYPTHPIQSPKNPQFASLKKGRFGHVATPPALLLLPTLSPKHRFDSRPQTTPAQLLVKGKCFFLGVQIPNIHLGTVTTRIIPFLVGNPYKPLKTNMSPETLARFDEICKRWGIGKIDMICPWKLTAGYPKWWFGKVTPF